MRVKLQLVLCSDEGHEKTVTDVMTHNKHSQCIEHLGLTLAEAKQLLSTLQRHLLQQQVDTFLDRCSSCADCGALLKVKAHASRSFRTLFGTCTLEFIPLSFWYDAVQSKYSNPLFSHSLQPNRCLHRTLNLTLAWLILNTMYGVVVEVK
jgi:hypothetical protein